MNVEAEFEALWGRMKLQGDWKPEWKRRFTKYSEPHRHYHNLGHITHMVRELLPILPLLKYPDEAMWTAIDHDVHLVPFADGRVVTDNEHRSALFAIGTLTRGGARHEVHSRIATKIRETNHKSSVTDRDTQYIVDADMAILGQPWREYSRYAFQGIMREFTDCGVPMREYLVGRSQFLTELRDRHIYYTTHFSNLYEDAAHINIARELGILEERLHAA